MLDRHQARFGRVLELVMRAFDSCLGPAVGFQLLDELLAVHGGYYNHYIEIVNTITTVEKFFILMLATPAKIP